MNQRLSVPRRSDKALTRFRSRGKPRIQRGEAPKALERLSTGARASAGAPDHRRPKELPPCLGCRWQRPRRTKSDRGVRHTALGSGCLGGVPGPRCAASRGLSGASAPAAHRGALELDRLWHLRLPSASGCSRAQQRALPRNGPLGRQLPEAQEALTRLGTRNGASHRRHRLASRLSHRQPYSQYDRTQNRTANSSPP